MFNFLRRSKKETHTQGDAGKKEADLSRTGADIEPGHQPLKYDVVASLQTDVGCLRQVNEDRVLLDRPGDPDVVARKGLLVLVADGMGGHSAGEVASGKAVDVINRVYYEHDGDTQSALKEAFNQASREIFEMSEQDESLKGMGTTCTALVLKNGTALAAHVGDSRLYLIRGGQIYLMTEDHSEVMEMVKRGLISLEEARHHPDKNVILRAIGSHPEVEVSTWDEPFPAREGDRFLLCSDGLYDLVEDEEIKHIVEEAEPGSACERLISLAKQRGGYDNISVGIVSLVPMSEGQIKPVRQTREVEAGI